MNNLTKNKELPNIFLYGHPGFGKITLDWMIAKLDLLVLLIIYSFSLEKIRLKLKQNGRFFRTYNEFSTLLAILIVTFVITKSIPIIFSIFITLFFGFTIYKITSKKDEII